MVTFGIERAININNDVPLGESILIHLQACDKLTDGCISLTGLDRAAHYDNDVQQANSDHTDHGLMARLAGSHPVTAMQRGLAERTSTPSARRKRRRPRLRVSQPWSSPASSAPLLHSSSAAALQKMAESRNQCTDPEIVLSTSVDVSERPGVEEQRLQSCVSARCTGAIEMLHNIAKANDDKASMTGVPCLHIDGDIPERSIHCAAGSTTARCRKAATRSCSAWSWRRRRTTALTPS